MNSTFSSSLTRKEEKQLEVFFLCYGRPFNIAFKQRWEKHKPRQIFAKLSKNSRLVYLIRGEHEEHWTKVSLSWRNIAKQYRCKNGGLKPVSHTDCLY